MRALREEKMRTRMQISNLNYVREIKQIPNEQEKAREKEGERERERKREKEKNKQNKTTTKKTN